MRVIFGMLFLCGVSVGAGVASYAQTVQGPRTPTYTITQAERGKRLYDTRCARCHGADLMGNPARPWAPVVRGMPTHTPALVGAEFSSDWNGLTVALLAERIRATMPRGTPGILTKRE